MQGHGSTMALASFAAAIDPGDTTGRSKTKTRLAAARSPAGLLDRRPAAVERLVAPLCGSVGHVGPSHVLFSAETLNPQHATFLNVTFGSSFDADDTHVGAMLHPGVAAWSAALAMAEHVGASGLEVLAAVVAGYETTIRIGLAVQPSHFKRGFQSTGTCDVFGTAAAAGRLLFRGKDAERRIAEAMGLAGSYAGGVAQFYYSGASAKAHPGRACGRERRRGRAARRAGLWRSGRHHRRRRRLCPRLCRRLESRRHRGRARHAST